MEPRPLTRQRSAWQRHPTRPTIDITDPTTGITVATDVWRRPVHDGTLRVFVGEEPWGWHLSISHAPAGKRSAPRYPTWDEILHARQELLPADVEFAMMLPRVEEYVAVHDTTFHLHEHPMRTRPEGTR